MEEKKDKKNNSTFEEERKNHKGKNVVKDETILHENLVLSESELVSDTSENKVVVEDKPVVLEVPKNTQKGEILYIAKYAALVKLENGGLIMKPEFVNCKVGDIVEF